MRYTQELWDAADSDDDADDDICKTLSLGDWLGQLALGRIEGYVGSFLGEGLSGTQLEALRDMKAGKYTSNPAVACDFSSLLTDCL